MNGALRVVIFAAATLLVISFARNIVQYDTSFDKLAGNRLVLPALTKKYPIPRQIKGAGAFPFSDGMFSDPHFSVSKIGEFQLRRGIVRTQIINTNYAFRTNLRKSELIVATSDGIEQVNLLNSGFELSSIGEPLVLESGEETIIIFTLLREINTKSSALADLHVGLIEFSMTGENTNLTVYSENSEEWVSVFNRLKSRNDTFEMKDRICLGHETGYALQLVEALGSLCD